MNKKFIILLISIFILLATATFAEAATKWCGTHRWDYNIIEITPTNYELRVRCSGGCNSYVTEYPIQRTSVIEFFDCNEQYETAVILVYTLTNGIYRYGLASVCANINCLDWISTPLGTPIIKTITNVSLNGNVVTWFDVYEGWESHTITICTCTPHAYSQCYNNDRWWYDSCDVREDKRQECGDDSCDAWGANYCKNDDVYHSRICHDRGCAAGRDACFDNTSTQEELVQDCGTSGWTDEYQCSGTIRQRKWINRGCSGGSCYSTPEWRDVEDCSTKSTDCGYGTCASDERPSWTCQPSACVYNCNYDPSCVSLGVTLSANPLSGNVPLNGVDLTADVSGTAAGTINYTFYCNRSDSGTNITAGYCHKKDNTNSDPYTAIDCCDYPSAGSYTAKVIAERGGLAAEHRINVTVNPPAPDLIVSDHSYSPSSPIAGNLMTFTGTVKNQGGSQAVASQTRLRIDIDNNGTYDVLPANQSTGALNAGATEIETWSKAWTATVGTHKYEICADEIAIVVESNETNNCITQTFTVASLPDLIISDYSYSPLSPIAGDSITFTGTVKNQGGSQAVASQTGLRIDLDNNGSWDIVLTNKMTNALNAGATEIETWNIWASGAGAPAGGHKYEICADEIAIVVESNETNNCITQTFTVAAANNPPEADTLDASVEDCCFHSSAGGYFRWNFSDPDGDNQDTNWSSWLQVDNNFDFSSLIIDCQLNAGNEFHTPLSSLVGPPCTSPVRPFDFNLNYYWQVQVRDEHDLASDWFWPPSPSGNPTASPGTPFNPGDEWPWPGFDYEINQDPGSPIWTSCTNSSCDAISVEVGDVITLDNKTTGCPNDCNWQWDFGDGSFISPDFNPLAHTYTLEGNFTLILKAKDKLDDSHYCILGLGVNVGVEQLPLPKWKEIAPF